VTTLQQRMREELVRRDFSPSGMRTYLQAVEAFQKWAGKPLEHAVGRGHPSCSVMKATM
jgi:hypothetical protein